MHQAALDAAASADVMIFSAAVADYRPATQADSKIKRELADSMQIELVENPDIAAECGACRRPGQTLVGFALETDHPIDNALAKLDRKHLDMIVLNSLRDPGAGFRTDTNKVTIITHRSQIAYTLKSKQDVAADIVDSIVSLRKVPADDKV